MYKMKVVEMLDNLRSERCLIHLKSI